MVPTPPPPPPWRFWHRPPRRRELVSLSCRIREHRQPPGSSLLRRNDSARGTQESPSRRGSVASCERAAGAPETRGSERRRREQQELRETGWHLQCGAQTVATGAGWEGSRAGASARAHRDGGGASAPNPCFSLSKQGGLSPRVQSQLGGQKPERRQGCRTSSKPGRDGAAASADTSKCPPSLSSQERVGGEGEGKDVRGGADPGAEKLADGDLNLQPKLCSCLPWPLRRRAKNHV